ncbi:hypothetical protein ACQRUO_39135, partial [Kitasatospora sp. LaBMicrA B282]
PAAPPAAPPRLTADLTAEAAWLAEVSAAFAGSPVVAAVRRRSRAELQAAGAAGSPDTTGPSPAQP